MGKSLLQGNTGPVCSQEITSPADAEPGPRPDRADPAVQKKGSFQGLGKPRAHLNAKKFLLHARSLARECAQPSVSLLLKSLESSEREEPWKTKHSSRGPPKPRVAGRLSTGAAHTLRPGRHSQPRSQPPPLWHDLESGRGHGARRPRPEPSLR